MIREAEMSSNEAATRAKLYWDLGASKLGFEKGSERLSEITKLERGWLQSVCGISRFSIRESVLTYLRGGQIEFVVYAEKSAILLPNIKGKAYQLYPGLGELIAVEGKEAGYISGTEEILKFLREI